MPCSYLQNGHEQLIKTYNQWKGSLRPDATLNFVAVTDDESDWTAQRFINDLRKKGKPDGIAQPSPGLPLGFVYHSIIEYTSKEVPGAGACPAGWVHERSGLQYLDLSARTKGAIHQVCESDWAPIFTDIANVVVKFAGNPCVQPIVLPAALAGANPTPTRVQFTNTLSGAVLFQATLAAGNKCPLGVVVAATFVVDSLAKPTSVTLCQPACGMLTVAGTLEFAFDGCGCRADVKLSASKSSGKADIVWWIDTSASMGDEAKYLNANINNFATYIENAGIDYRLILVGESGKCIKADKTLCFPWKGDFWWGNGGLKMEAIFGAVVLPICVAPPLGKGVLKKIPVLRDGAYYEAPGCEDSNLPKYTFVKQYIDSVVSWFCCVITSLFLCLFI